MKKNLENINTYMHCKISDLVLVEISENFNLQLFGDSVSSKNLEYCIYTLDIHKPLFDVAMLLDDVLKKNYRKHK